MAQRELSTRPKDVDLATGDDALWVRLFAAGNSYWLTRFAILRLLGFVYAIAFLIAAQQLVPLVGEHGLTPASHFLLRSKRNLAHARPACCNCRHYFGSVPRTAHYRSLRGLVLVYRSSS